MKHHTMPAFAVAAIVAMLGATSALADRDLTRQVRGSATGDWSCQLGESAIGTLSVRASSYVLSRPGSTMAGEYQQADERIIVSNGPLRGLGVEGGTLADEMAARTLEFPTAGGAVLACREIL